MNFEQRLSTVLDAGHLRDWQGQCLLRGLDSVLMMAPLVIVAMMLLYPIEDQSTQWFLWSLPVVYAVMFLLRKMVIWHTNRRLNQIAFEYGLEQRRYSLQHLLAIPLEAYTKLHRGTISQSLSQDLLWLETWYSFTAPLLLVDGAAILLLLAGAFILHWPLTLIAVMILCIGALLLRVVLNIIFRIHRTHSDNLIEATRLVGEYVKGMDLLRAFGQAGAQEGQFRQTVENICQHAKQGVRSALPGAALFFTIVQLALAVSILVILWVNQQGLVVEQGTFALMDISSDENRIRALMTMLILTALNTPIRSLFTYLNMWNLAKVASTNLEQMDRVAKQPNGLEHELIGSLTIEFSEVSYRYENTNFDAISRASFYLSPRSITAVVGPSGAGKSTLMKLLMRFADASEGVISLAGKDIRDLDIATLHNQFAIVFQETVLFRDTIANNIRVGKSTASLTDIMDAAKKACIHDKIMSLPDGYETLFDASGRSLSGGERQRIAIARAILKDAPIIILDEATSALDPENQDLIQQAISALAHSKTVLMIAHRLGTIVDADQIIVVQEGRIVGLGQHVQLLENNEVYRVLWRAYCETRQWNMGVYKPLM